MKELVQGAQWTHGHRLPPEPKATTMQAFGSRVGFMVEVILEVRLEGCSVFCRWKTEQKLSRLSLYEENAFLGLMGQSRVCSLGARRKKVNWGPNCQVKGKQRVPN